MFLREFLAFDQNKNDFSNDRRYNNDRDRSVLTRGDTRKIKLTLRQINQLRLQAEAHQAEHEAELGFIRQMYGNPSGEEEA